MDIRTSRFVRFGRNWRSRRLCFGLAAVLAGCTVGPDYQKPAAILPPTYKELAGWKPAAPQDLAERGPWWSVYHDAVLDQLEAQIQVSNQTLKADQAAFEQSQAVLGEARANQLPTITATGSITNSGGSSGSRSSSSTTRVSTSSAGQSVTEGSFGASLSWDLDLWGRLRRITEGDVATAEASAADLASARLSLQATLADDYFTLRIQDEQEKLLTDTIAQYQRALDIVSNQYKAGTTARSDVITAMTQLKSAEAQRVSLGVLRAQMEHAIALLIGKPPGEFSLPPAALGDIIPVAPVGIPSRLLERRPDIAAAERLMAAANANIGAAIAAYYPDFTLSGSNDYTSPNLSKLFRASSAIWSVASQASLAVYDGGLRDATVAAARASYDQAVANYRQTVLTGFCQVEDGLSNLRILEQQEALQREDVKLADEAVRLTLNEYKAGIIAYTTVVVAETTALSTAESALTIRENRLTASVNLIEALGGGWTVKDLPDLRALP